MSSVFVFAVYTHRFTSCPKSFGFYYAIYRQPYIDVKNISQVRMDVVFGLDYQTFICYVLVSLEI